MYDSLSSDYDRFVSWPGRLAFEMPFLERALQPLAQGRRVRVLDAACGTGMHAIELARRGYAALGADLSAAMILRARENAAAAGVSLRFEAAGFGGLAHTFADEAALDGVICLGNSLPHVLSLGELAAALADFGALLRPGGLLVLQNRNFDAVMAKRERWMEPQSQREGEAEWLFLRSYDFEADGLITFHIITLKRVGSGGWTQKVDSTRLLPLLHADLKAALEAAGFGDLRAYGSMAGEAFDPALSGNLVWTARKAA